MKGPDLGVALTLKILTSLSDCAERCRYPTLFPAAMDRSRLLVATNLMLITVSSSPLPIHVYLPLCLVFVCMMNITFDAS